MRTASDGIMAVEILSRRDWRPHLVLMDLRMPNVDGMELMASIRTQPRLDGLRTIAVTGMDRAEHEQLALDAGFSALLTKPVHVKDLLAAVTNCLA